MNAPFYKTDKTFLRGGFAFIQPPGKVSFQMTVPLQVQAEVSPVLGDPDTAAIFSILAPTLLLLPAPPQTIDFYTTLSQK